MESRQGKIHCDNRSQTSLSSAWQEAPAAKHGTEQKDWVSRRGVSICICVCMVFVSVSVSDIYCLRTGGAKNRLDKQARRQMR